MWVSQTFGEETSSATEINMMILHNFYFPTTGLLLEPFLSDICLCYNDTRCRNCSSIAIVNREKYQIINVPSTSQILKLEATGNPIRR